MAPKKRLTLKQRARNQKATESAAAAAAARRGQREEGPQQQQPAPAPPREQRPQQQEQQEGWPSRSWRKNGRTLLEQEEDALEKERQKQEKRKAEKAAAARERQEQAAAAAAREQAAQAEQEEKQRQRANRQRALEGLAAAEDFSKTAEQVIGEALGDGWHNGNNFLLPKWECLRCPRRATCFPKHYKNATHHRCPDFWAGSTEGGPLWLVEVSTTSDPVSEKLAAYNLEHYRRNVWELEPLNCSREKRYERLQCPVVFFVLSASSASLRVAFRVVRDDEARTMARAASTVRARLRERFGDVVAFSF
jgi:hypothetical protein